MSPSGFHIAAPVFSPLADGLALGLDHLCLPFCESPVGEGEFQFRTDDPIRRWITDPEEAIAELRARDPERNAPASAAEISLALHAQERLERVIRAQSHPDLDLEIHLTRFYLRKLEDRAASRAAPQNVTLLSLFQAPLLWRLGILDDRCRLYLLTGFPALVALQDHLAENHVFSKLETRVGADAFLRHSLALSPVLTAEAIPQDQETPMILAPEGKILPPEPRKTKTSSIGTAQRFR